MSQNLQMINENAEMEVHAVHDTMEMDQAQDENGNRVT